MDYIRAIDLLIDTRGETFTLPLSWSVAVAMFPGLQNRVTQRRDHRERIMELRDQRKTTSHSQSKEISFHTAKAISSQRLNFCRPGSTNNGSGTGTMRSMVSVYVIVIFS
jgi:hypothetical protein